jgi:Peptidase_C39 like family/Bacterial Ig-like domain
VTLNPTSGPAGTLVTATGCGWTPGAPISVSWENQQPLPDTTVDPSGAFTVHFSVPSGATQGNHQVFFSQSCTGGCLSRFQIATFTVMSGPSPVPTDTPTPAPPPSGGSSSRPSPVKPGGLWIRPKHHFVVHGHWLHHAAHAYPTHPGDPPIDHVQFTAWWRGVNPNKWYVPPTCTVNHPTPGTRDTYECNWNVTKSGVPKGPLTVSFDVYDTAGNKNLAPHGTREGKVKRPVKKVILPSGVWIMPKKNGFVVNGDWLHLAANAYPMSQGDPPIAYVNFTAGWQVGKHVKWTQVCHVTQPRPRQPEDIYECNWNLALSHVPNGSLTVSFDVYDKAGNEKLAPNGTRAGVVQHTVPTTASAPLNVRFISQYPDGWLQAKRTQDCGPASVGMVVTFFNQRPAGLTDYDFITQIRQKVTGELRNRDFTFSQLEIGVSDYGLTYNVINGPTTDDALQAMKNAVASGNPVIALVHGYDLGRGSAYGDHFVVVTGFPDDQTVYLKDSDQRSPKMLQGVGAGPGWINGGQITLDYAVFSNALTDAKNAQQGGPYGIIVSAQ